MKRIYLLRHAKSDWEAAYQLLEQMQSRFGYSREAAQFRRLVDSQRVKSMTTVIEETQTAKPTSWPELTAW